MTREDPSPARQHFSFWIEGFHLLACLAGFSMTAWIYAELAHRNDFGPGSREAASAAIIGALVAWSAVVSTGNPAGDGVRLWIDRLFSAIGFNLVFQYGLVYLFHLTPSPWPVAVGGSIFAVGLIAVFQKHLFHSAPGDYGSTLLLGYDSLAQSILPALGPLVSVLDSAPENTSPERLSRPRLLGDLSRFEEALATEKPRRIVINIPNWSSVIRPRRLLALRHDGVVVENAPTLSEGVLNRVSWQRLDHLDLVLSPRLSINGAAIALQAVYTNIIGLALLALLSPVLLLGGLLVSLTTASFPLESAVCLGFHRIPFRAVRFRTHRRDGHPSWAGRLLTKLRLVNVPQLVNVVRGEMALFGPPPVRKEFADRLSQLIPLCAHRFIVKPGIMGWSQANLGHLRTLPDESLRLEYDLYYIREESPSLDLDILFRTVFRAPLRTGAPPR